MKCLGDRQGKHLELLAEYLFSCMPGCRTKRRQKSHSTDYDIVCSMEGADLDFRSELGRHFVCECTDWARRKADLTAVAKLCRVLDSTKARLGVLFTPSRVSKEAQRERVNVFQDRGIVLAVIDRSDLEAVGSGANFVALLRRRYEEVRLDLWR